VSAAALLLSQVQGYQMMVGWLILWLLVVPKAILEVVYRVYPIARELTELYMLIQSHLLAGKALAVLSVSWFNP
jgi:hypothetical protein